MEDRIFNPVLPAQTLYLDTSVIGGYYDSEFMADTRALWRLMERGAYRFYSSRVGMNELRGAPLPVRELAARTFADSTRILDVSPEAFALARAYVAAGVVPTKFADDAAHVAVATCEGIGLIVILAASENWAFHGGVGTSGPDGFGRRFTSQPGPKVPALPQFTRTLKIQ